MVQEILQATDAEDRKREEHLRKREEQLRKREEQLRDEKMLLLKAGVFYIFVPTCVFVGSKHEAGHIVWCKCRLSTLQACLSACTCRYAHTACTLIRCL